ncbi:unnamed protein product [Diamesa serratosioi]
MDYKSDRLIINSKDHTIADFPRGLQIIFDYLPAKDLITCLAVCKATNFEIATSEKLMNKIVLKIPAEQKLLADDILSITNRKYKHICIQSDNEYMLDFQNEHFQWKSLHFHGLTFGPSMWNFLRQFRETISELNFSDNEVELSLDDKFPVFVKLNTMKIKCEATETAMIYSQFHLNYDTLKNLTISQFGFEFAISVIRKTKKQVQLDTLHFTQPRIQRRCTVALALKAQKSCLKELTLERLNSSSMEYIWEEMKVLKKLTLGSMVPVFKKDMLLATNSSIKHIVIHSTTVPLKVYGLMIDATPNLETLLVTNKNNMKRDNLTCTKYNGIELRVKFQDNEHKMLSQNFNKLRLRH